MKHHVWHNIQLDTNRNLNYFYVFQNLFSRNLSPMSIFDYLGRPQAWDWNSKSLPKRYRTFWRMLPPLSFAQLRWHWQLLSSGHHRPIRGQYTVTSDQWEARAGPGPLPSLITSCQHFPHWWQTLDTDHWPLTTDHSPSRERFNFLNSFAPLIEADFPIF